MLNLSDHSQLIHQQLSKLKELTDKLTSSTWGLESWLQSLGIGGWLRELIRGALVVLIKVIVILLVVPCLFQCLQRMFLHSVQSAWLIETQKGGIMEAQFGSQWNLLNTKIK